jgi:hypothetical protein
VDLRLGKAVAAVAVAVAVVAVVAVVADLVGESDLGFGIGNRLRLDDGDGNDRGPRAATFVVAASWATTGRG